MRRLFWMALGVAAGAVAAVWALAGVRRVRTSVSPEHVPERVRGLRRRVRQAVAEGRAAMAAYEAEADRRWGTDPASDDARVVPLRRHRVR